MSKKKIFSTVVGSYPQPEWLVNRDLLKKRVPFRILSEQYWKIDKSKINYLINRIERSYNHALKIAKLIDKKSLESHSQISFNFLKKILEN